MLSWLGKGRQLTLERRESQEQNLRSSVLTNRFIGCLLI
jgi:hypothetical protein